MLYKTIDVGKKMPRPLIYKLLSVSAKKMEDKFFDNSILENIKSQDYPIAKHYKDLKYYLNEEDSLSFHLEINEQRLNSSEIKAILALNEKEKFLNDSDRSILAFMAQKLGMIQTIYKIGSSEIEFFLERLKESSIEILYNSEPLHFDKGKYKLSFEMILDDNSNITIRLKEDGRFRYGEERLFLQKGDTIYTIETRLPVKFYKEIIEEKNKFSIENFLKLKDTFLPTLEKVHDVKMDDDIRSLNSLSIEEKIAPIIMEVGKTAHFITMELKYKIGEESFPVINYRYAQTSTWQEKPSMIKIARESNRLIKYISDDSLDDDVFNRIFATTRMRANRNTQNPFQVMLPISSMDTFVTRIEPLISKLYEIEYKEGQKLELSNENVRFELDTRLSTRLNLFEFNVKFKVKDQYFDLEFLKDLMLQNKKFVQLKDGTTANIENIREINKWIEFLNRFEFKRSQNNYKTQSSVALELDEFLKEIKEKEINSNQEYKNAIQELKHRKPVEEIKIPENVEGILREYQKEGVYWLYFLQKYGFGGILADEMGLGKTIQALTVLAMNPNSTHLVVCPKSLIYNWDNEIKRYFPDQKVLIIDKDSEKRKELIQEANHYDILITSYSMLQKDFQDYIDNKIDINYMIMDEAHYVKNMQTLSSKAVRVIPAARKVLLTGTPLENNLEELYGTFELVMPNYLGSKMDFRKDFVSKIERNNMIALEILQARIRPFILRRTKSQVLKELPEKQEQIVYNEMTNKQIGIYNEVLNRVKRDLNALIQEVGFEKARIQVLSALLKLRQICNHPALVDKQFDEEEDISGKYEQFLELLSEITESGKKVLVFSQFTSMLDIFERDLNHLGITFVRLDGSTKNRQDVVDQFNEDENIKVFLISLKAGGVGLNLTSASAVFLYDPWWNPMAEQQAIDRAHRIGQTQKVNIYKFITRNSIEEKILKLQERKGNLFENLVVEDSGYFKRLEWEDLMELFD